MIVNTAYPNYMAGLVNSIKNDLMRGLLCMEGLSYTLLTPFTEHDFRHRKESYVIMIKVLFGCWGIFYTMTEEYSKINALRELLK